MIAPTPGALIERVEPGSLAADAGVLPGFRLLGINGETPLDVLDVQFAEYDAEVSLAFLTLDDHELTIDFAKDEGEPLGLGFETPVFDGVRRCNNACTFCFCDQLPTGLRPSLYLRDDDYRLSFLHGNYVTLTNLTDDDCDRIARLRLSPLYVSVHAVSPDVRARLFRGRHSADLLPSLDRLLADGIELHAQVVLVPGVNDGEELDRTVTELGVRQPGVASLAIVPVGLSEHRAALAEVEPVTRDVACSLLDRIASWQATFLDERGVRFVFGSDELYLLAERDFPAAEAYDDYPQLENGVGLARLFRDDLDSLAATPELGQCLGGKRLLLATGLAAAPLLRQFAGWLNQHCGTQTEVVPIRNRLLGEQVTVAGLLAGRDLIDQLRGHEAELVLIPAACVNDEGLLLDEVTVPDLTEALSCAVVPTGPLPSRAANHVGEVLAPTLARGHQEFF